MMITPLSNMEVYKEVITDDSEVNINQHTPEPIISYYKSQISDVKSVGDGTIVGMYDDNIIIKTTFTRQINVNNYQIGTKVVELEDGSYQCEWVTPEVEAIVNTYYITYYGVNSDLIIGYEVQAGDIIGSLSTDKLGISVTLLCGIDIEFETLIL